MVVADAETVHASPLARFAASSDACLTMSTVEIAELTGKRHADVLRDADVMLTALQKDQRTFASIFFDNYGRPQPCLNLPKLECLTLVTGYSAEPPALRVKGGVVVADSRDVAASFDKRHDHVLRDIRDVVAKLPPGSLPKFGAFTNQGLTDPNRGKVSHYEMDRDAFSLLTMGFTGPKVIERAEQIAEYARLTKEKRGEVSAQVGPKPKGGRPEGGDRQAARDLGLTRQEVQRAERVASIAPEAKEAARKAGLGDNQSARD